jgi:hypothetical protein
MSQNWLKTWLKLQLAQYEPEMARLEPKLFPVYMYVIQRINEEKHKLVHTINRRLDQESNPRMMFIATGMYGANSGLKNTHEYCICINAPILCNWATALHTGIGGKSLISGNPLCPES